MDARRYRFVFDSAPNARIYVGRAAERLQDIAFLVMSNVVVVLDGAPEPERDKRRAEIIRLAHFSGGSRTAVDLPLSSE